MVNKVRFWFCCVVFSTENVWNMFKFNDLEKNSN